MRIVINCIILIFFSFSLLCCNDVGNSHSYKEYKSDSFLDSSIYFIQHGEYPKEVKDLNATKAFDELLWRMYCVYCDINVLFEKDYFPNVEDTNITYGMLPVEFSKIWIEDDSLLNLEFNYYYDQKRLTLFNVKNLAYYGGIINRNQDYSIMFFFSTAHFPMMLSCDPNDSNNCPREQVPLQPDVVNFIKKNNRKLAPWFKYEAIKRGIVFERSDFPSS